MQKEFEKILKRKQNSLKRAQNKYNTFEALMKKIESVLTFAPKNISITSRQNKIQFVVQNRTEALLCLDKIKTVFKPIDIIGYEQDLTRYRMYFPAGFTLSNAQMVDKYNPIYLVSRGSNEFLCMYAEDKCYFEIKSPRNAHKPTGLLEMNHVYFDHPSKQNNLPISKALGI